MLAVEERERARDEDILRLGSDPKVYAEGDFQGLSVPGNLSWSARLKQASAKKRAANK